MELTYELLTTIVAHTSTTLNVSTYIMGRQHAEEDTVDCGRGEDDGCAFRPGNEVKFDG